MRQWQDAGKRLSGLQRTLYFELESLRQRDATRLVDAVRSTTKNNFPIDNWSRVLDYRYSLAPLSIVGSTRLDGGRFNIGAELNPVAFSAFPALYLAEDFQTAFRERFGSNPGIRYAELSGEERALRRVDSFTQVRVRGLVETVLDIGDLAALQPIVEVLKGFALPKVVPQTARKLGLRQAPWLIRSAVSLQRQLLNPNWRMLPSQFDLPANSQVFGRLAAAAGVHGILYPSVRNSQQHCLALFPQNWSSSNSFVEVADRVPEAARLTRIDGTSEYRYDR